MGKLLIDAVTGTILDVENCYIVDDNTLTEDEARALDEGASDSEIKAIAEKGKSLWDMGRDTGWGDNAYRFTVSYSPLSLKDEALSLIESGMYEEDEEDFKRLQWLTTATQEQLEQVAYWVMEDDNVWEGFKNNFLEALTWVYKAEIETE